MIVAWTGIAVVGVGLLFFLLGEWVKRPAVVWIAKPVASVGFLIVAWEHGALSSTYGIVIFVGLALSVAGDILLIPKAQLAFLGGLGAFLLGHIAYAIAFAIGGSQSLWIVLALLALLPVRLAVLRWLGPHLPDEMQLPVQAYAGIITIMLAFAVGMIPVPNLLAVAGALLFYISDLAVARGRFVKPGFANLTWGLPTYYGGQVLIALSVA